MKDFKLIFSEPWSDIKEYQNGDAFKNQLEKEIHQNHSLFGKEFKILAKRIDNDDILIELANGQLAVVHLTWSANIQLGFPSTTFYSYKEEFLKKMSDDNSEYNLE